MLNSEEDSKEFRYILNIEETLVSLGTLTTVIKTL